MMPTRFDRIVWGVIGALIILIGLILVVNTLIDINLPGLTTNSKVGIARLPEVVYLSPASDKAALWRTEAGASPVQLSSPGQVVFDYVPASDGESVVYSVLNDLGGLDLWQTDRNGKKHQILVKCQNDQCGSPAISPDQKMLAFVRLPRLGNSESNVGVRQIWVYGIDTRQANPLFPSSNQVQLLPSWSPDGKRLSFYEPSSETIRVINLQGGQEMRLPSSEEFSGSWSPDGSKMLFINADLSEEGRPYNQIYLASFLNRQLTFLLNDHQNQTDYSLPVWLPDGEWMVYASSPSGLGAAKQLWLSRIDGSDQLQITDANQYTHAAYHWDPIGERLVYQRFEQGNGGAIPEIMIWDRQGGKLILIAVDAFMPNWLP